MWDVSKKKKGKKMEKVKRGSHKKAQSECEG
jgi:hypothetical protein